MKTIDIDNIIDSRQLDKNQVAEQLFPTHKHPRLALNRVAKGVDGAVLDANQISKLSLLSGLTISELYSETPWKAINNKGVHVFTNGDFRAELDTSTWITKVFHKKSLFHDSVIVSRSVGLDEYFKKLNSLISKFQHNESN